MAMIHDPCMKQNGLVRHSCFLFSLKCQMLRGVVVACLCVSVLASSFCSVVDRFFSVLALQTGVFSTHVIRAIILARICSCFRLDDFRVV